jgi:hypothetical protein
MSSRFPATEYLVANNAFKASPFTLIDLGCSGGINERWRVFGNDLHAYAIDVMVDEIEKLRAAEINENIKYYACHIGLPQDHPVIRSRGGKDPFGDNPWNRLSTAWASELLASKKEEEDHDTKVYLNKWPEANLVDPSIRIGLSQFVKENQIDNIDFIKIDIDGEDYYALLSGEDLIASREVLGFFLEVNYYGTDCDTDHTFHNTDRFMRRHKYKLFDLSVRHYSRRAMPSPFIYDIPAQTHWGAPLQGDALYCMDAVLMQHHPYSFNFSSSKLLKLAAMYELFGLPDCAAEVLIANERQLSEHVNVAILLDLLTPAFEGNQLSYQDYIKCFTEDITRFYPKR